MKIVDTYLMRILKTAKVIQFIQPGVKMIWSFIEVDGTQARLTHYFPWNFSVKPVTIGSQPLVIAMNTANMVHVAKKRIIRKS